MRREPSQNQQIPMNNHFPVPGRLQPYSYEDDHIQYSMYHRPKRTKAIRHVEKKRQAL